MENLTLPLAQNDQPAAPMAWVIPAIAGVFGVLAITSFVLTALLQSDLKKLRTPEVAPAQTYTDIDPALANEISSVLEELAMADPVVEPVGDAPYQAQMPTEELDFSQSLAPITTSANLPRWRRNAGPLPFVPEGMAKIAIVIDDLGERHDPSAKALDLPPEVTLAFLPFGESSLSLAKEAKTLGHEILVHMPMQPLPRADGTQIDPGPNGLWTTMSQAELKEKTQANLADFLSLAVGTNNHMGSAMTGDKAAMQAVLSVVEENELLFLDSLTTPKSMVTSAGQSLQTPLLRRDVFLDHFIEREKIDAMLEKTIEVALKNGSAIAIGHPYQVTYDAIQDWLPTLAARNIQLVPLTALVIGGDV